MSMTDLEDRMNLVSEYHVVKTGFGLLTLIYCVRNKPLYFWATVILALLRKKNLYLNFRNFELKLREIQSQRESNLPFSGIKRIQKNMFHIGMKSASYLLFSYVQLFGTPWIVAHQAPLYLGFFPCKNTRVGCHFLP